MPTLFYEGHCKERFQSCWVRRKQESHAGHNKDFRHKLFLIQYTVSVSLLLLLILIITIIIIHPPYNFQLNSGHEETWNLLSWHECKWHEFFYQLIKKSFQSDEEWRLFYCNSILVCRVIQDFGLCELDDLWRHIVDTKWCKITKYGISVQMPSVQGWNFAGLMCCKNYTCW